MRLPRHFAPRSDKKGGFSQWQKSEKFLVLTVSLCILPLLFVIAGHVGNCRGNDMLCCYILSRHCEPAEGRRGNLILYSPHKHSDE
jgi:hypothetical protein